MEPLIENIVTKLQSLPQTRLHEILNFVEFVNWQEQYTTQPKLSESDAAMSNEDFETLTNQLVDEFGKCYEQASCRQIS